MSIRSNLKIVGKFHLPDDETEGGDFFRLNAELWTSLPSSISNRVYIHDNVEVSVSANWESVRVLTHEANRILQSSIVASKSALFEWLEPIPSDIEVPVTVIIKGKNSLSGYDRYPSVFVENYIYDVFTILNLALPGAADFMNLAVHSDAKGVVVQPTKIGSYYLYMAYATSDEWPFLAKIDAEIVEKWYSVVRCGISQVPDSPLEQAIFAMLHVCKSDGRPEDIIWLFYAFESLLQTRVGENFAALVDRLALILCPNAGQEARMRKRLREMYTHRSSFVHGGLKIIHPMHNEVMDRRVDDSYTSTIDLSQYGIKLLMACLQKYVRNDWYNVCFRTAVEAT